MIVIVTIICRLLDPTNKIAFKICILKMAVILINQPCGSTGLVPPLGHRTESACMLHQQTTRQDAQTRLCPRAPASSCLRLLQTPTAGPSRDSQLGETVCRMRVLPDCKCWFLSPHPGTSYWWLEIYHGGNIYTIGIGKLCKSRFFSFLHPTPTGLVVEYHCLWPLEQQIDLQSPCRAALLLLRIPVFESLIINQQ